MFSMNADRDLELKQTCNDVTYVDIPSYIEHWIEKDLVLAWGLTIVSI